MPVGAPADAEPHILCYVGGVLLAVEIPAISSVPQESGLNLVAPLVNESSAIGPAPVPKVIKSVGSLRAITARDFVELQYVPPSLRSQSRNYPR